MTKQTTLGVVLCLIAAVVVVGCQDEGPAPARPAPVTPSAKPAPRPSPRPTARPAPAPVRAAGTVTSALALPTGDRASSPVLAEITAPEIVLAGKPFTHTIKLTSLAAKPLTGVVLTEDFPKNFTASATAPKAVTTATTAKWTIGTLAPRASKIFTVTGTAGATGAVVPCIRVAFDIPELCVRFRAVRPALQVVKTGPAKIIVCDPITYKIVVTNTGTGTATNVKVTDALPAGMKTLDGRTSAAFHIPSLAQGESQSVTVQAKVAKVGSYVNKAVATADNGVRAESAPVTTVATLPVLAVTKTAPANRFVGRPITYNITVANKGDAEARDTVLVDTLPAGVTFQSASAGGVQAGGKITWKLGTLAAGASKSVSATVVATQKGTLTNLASATAYCAAGSAKAQTVVKGIPAILLECVDVADPIEVGANETYVIRVTNQGSAVGTNIVVTATLPAEQAYVSSDGPTKAAVKAQTVTFAPLATLAPKAVATYKVVVKGTGVGDVRFKVSLTSDQMTTPAEETESTHIYK